MRSGGLVINRAPAAALFFTRKTPKARHSSAGALLSTNHRLCRAFGVAS
jgi:hypothetical protein